MKRGDSGHLSRKAPHPEFLLRVSKQYCYSQAYVKEKCGFSEDLNHKGHIVAEPQPNSSPAPR